MTHDIPVVDLFAGPGGLSEGFHRYKEWAASKTRFSINLSIEKDPVAHKTLTLRAFFRRFAEGSVPEAYYRYVQAVGAAEKRFWRQELERHPEWPAAAAEARLAELGGADMPTEKLITLVRDAVGDARDWVLLGGPPCQAYSLMGRARRTGVGLGGRKSFREELKKQRESEFLRLEMHSPYRQYIGILALLQPSVFIMENVRGILSSKDPQGAAEGRADARIFPRILSDVSKPTEALGRELQSAGVESLKGFAKGPVEYEIHSFVAEADGSDDSCYLIKSELYGVPQKRHRVILLGIRKDFNLKPNQLVPSPLGLVPIKNVIGNLPKRTTRPSKFKGSDEEVAKLVKAEFKPSIRRSLDERIMTRVDACLTQRLAGSTLFHSQADCFQETLNHPLQAWLGDPRLEKVLQHEPRGHMPSDLARYLFSAAFAEFHERSPRLHDFPKGLLPKHRNVKPGLKKGGKLPFADRFRVQVEGSPCNTITSHISKDGHYYIHYDVEQNRSLTVREAARLQTFPDNYFFEGERTDQFRQIGNAVPPFLAVQLAQVVAELLAAARDAADLIGGKAERVPLSGAA